MTGSGAQAVGGRGTPRLELVQGDITQQVVDAIVNAVNSALAGGGGVDGAIHRAAGARELRAACAALGGCPPGDARWTPGFRLPARWVIHTVGPRWRGGGAGEADVLASCYCRCLAVADELGARSVAFPAIATGVYGFPPEAAAAIALDTIRRTPTSVVLVRVVAYDAVTAACYERLVAEPAAGPATDRGRARDPAVSGATTPQQEGS